MTQSTQPNRIRRQIAENLDAWADEGGWNEERWTQFNALMKSTHVDGLLAHAEEELIHFSGLFHARNIFLVRVKPEKNQIESYRDEFRNIAIALRSETTWEQYKRANRIFEGRDLNRAIVQFFKKLFWS